MYVGMCLWDSVCWTPLLLMCVFLRIYPIQTKLKALPFKCLPPPFSLPFSINFTHLNLKENFDLPCNLLEIVFTTWLLAASLTTALLPDMSTPGRILILKWRLKIIKRHLLMVNGCNWSRHWRHNPNPICRTSIAIVRK